MNQENQISAEIMNKYKHYKNLGWSPHIVYNAANDTHFVSIFFSREYTESFLMLKVIL